ncbi:MAG: 30S ribosomal protein S3 [bacterium]
MGQKTHPIGIRLGINRTWKSLWFDEKTFSKKLEEDLMLRKYVNNRMPNAGISLIEIRRIPKRITLTIYTARPGIVIGKKGAEVDKLKEELQRLTSQEIQVNIHEIKRPELDAYLVAENVARQIESKVSFRRAMKRAITATMRMGAEGVKIACAGRLGGSEMARREQYREGRVPLHTLRADIDYARIVANTAYGTIGVKVWICKGDVSGV